MRVLVWQWGRRGAGPRYAAALATSLRSVRGVAAPLSMSAQSELLQADDGPPCELPVSTYDGLGGFALQYMLAPLRARRLEERVRVLRPDIALCAMPAPLDRLMATVLGRLRIPYAVVVHDADAHPGDGFPMQMALQRLLTRKASALVALTGHVADRLIVQGVAPNRLIRSRLPPFVFGPPPPPPRSHGGPLRLLSFGRLLPYKGLDLLAEAMTQLQGRTDIELRVVGQGPESEALAALRRMPMARVENRWVPEGEVAALLAWADALVLSHREASQSGTAAAAIAARRYVVATNVGGIGEQLAGDRMSRLCDPTGESLARAISALAAETPPLPGELPLIDAAAAWRGTAMELAAALAPFAKAS